MDDTLTEATVADANNGGMLVDQREELTEYLRSRLIECGWRDQVASRCRDLIQKRGVEHVKLTHLINEVRSEAKLKVPESVRNDILAKMRQVSKPTLDLEK